MAALTLVNLTYAAIVGAAVGLSAYAMIPKHDNGNDVSFHGSNSEMPSQTTHNFQKSTPEMPLLLTYDQEFVSPENTNLEIATKNQFEIIQKKSAYAFHIGKENKCIVAIKRNYKIEESEDSFTFLNDNGVYRVRLKNIGDEFLCTDLREFTKYPQGCFIILNKHGDNFYIIFKHRSKVLEELQSSAVLAGKTKRKNRKHRRRTVSTRR